MNQIVERIIIYICMFLAVLLVLPFHEFAHAFAAVKCGDETPRVNGRYTLNPFAHFDVLGLACFVLVGFGWAKPVPVNPYNFRHYKRGMVWVSIAGVLANLIMAFLVYPLYELSLLIPDFGYFDDVVSLTLSFAFSMNLTFFIFNILPFYPLDGFRVIDATVNHSNPVYRFLRNYGQYILLALIVLSFIADWVPALAFLDVLGLVIGNGAYYLGLPIQLFWGLFF